MVYESGFTTRRTYVSRPVVTSYAVSYRSPSYSYYTTPSRIYTGSYYSYLPSYISSPVRHSSYVYRSSISPVRTIRSTSYVHVPRYVSYYSSTPSIRTYYPSITSYSIPSYTPYLKSYSYDIPSVLSVPRPFRRASSVCSYYSPSYASSEAFENFQDESIKIRSRAQSLMRDIHTPVIRYSRSCTPFPIMGHEPTTPLALDSYVSRITNPIRNVAKDVHNLLNYPDRPRTYIAADLDPDRPSRKYTATKTLENLFEEKIEEELNKRKNRKNIVSEKLTDIDLSNITERSAEMYNVNSKKVNISKESKEKITLIQEKPSLKERKQESMHKKRFNDPIVNKTVEVVDNNDLKPENELNDSIDKSTYNFKTNGTDNEQTMSDNLSDKLMFADDTVNQEPQPDITQNQDNQSEINETPKIDEIQSELNDTLENQNTSSKNNDTTENEDTQSVDYSTEYQEIHAASDVSIAEIQEVEPVSDVTDIQDTQSVKSENQDFSENDINPNPIATEETTEPVADQSHVSEEFSVEEQSYQSDDNEHIEQNIDLIEKSPLQGQCLENVDKYVDLTDNEQTSEETNTVNEVQSFDNTEDDLQKKLKLEQSLQHCEEELNRLTEITKDAEQFEDSELANQAAELAEIARHETALAAQQLEENKNLLLNLEKASIDEESSISDRDSISSDDL